MYTYADRPTTEVEPVGDDIFPKEDTLYSLLCSYDARPNPIHYMWTRDGAQLDDTGQVLTLALQHPRDTANFTCTATNDLDEGDPSDQYELWVYCE